MTPLSLSDLTDLLDRPCPGCGSRHLRVLALLPGVMVLLAGEPVSSIRWESGGRGQGQKEREELAARAYRVQCAECASVVWERSECPLCGAAGGRDRMLAGQNGMPVPSACPGCGQEEVRLVAEVRALAEFAHGTLSRRVAAAELHEPGFHVREVRCPGCEETFPAPSIRCVACARSSLLRRPR